MNWKVTAAGLMATAVAGLVGLTTPPVPDADVRDPARRASPVRPAAAAATSISEEAVRLRARLRAETAYREPDRNPFRFGAGRPASSAPVARAQTPGPTADVPAVAPSPPPPPIVLSGVATEVVAGASRRTAILGTIQGVLLVREGDAVGAEYRVTKVEQQAVELVTPDGTVRRIALTSRP